MQAFERGYSIATMNLNAQHLELALLPNDGTYTMGNVLELTAVVRGRLTELEGARSYRWQLFGYGGTLDDGAGKTGTTIVTEREAIKVRTNKSSRGTVSVEVPLLLTPEGGEPEAVAASASPSKRRAASRVFRAGSRRPTVGPESSESGSNPLTRTVLPPANTLETPSRDGDRERENAPSAPRRPRLNSSRCSSSRRSSSARHTRCRGCWRPCRRCPSRRSPTRARAGPSATAARTGRGSRTSP